MAYGTARAAGPKLDIPMDDLLPYRTALSDGTPVVLQRLLMPRDLVEASQRSDSGLGYRVTAQDIAAANRSTSPFCTLAAAISSAHLLLNHEISMGISYPFESTMTAEEFDGYFLGSDAFILRVDVEALVGSRGAPPRPVGHTTRPDPIASVMDLPDPLFVGCFYVKPNYPGRSNHMCNGGFLTAPAYRGRGAGFIMGERYRFIAQRLGYRGSVFNLVFLDNPASMRLWEKLKFTRIGPLPGAGRHPVKPGCPDAGEHYVSAYLWYLDLTQPLQALPLPLKTMTGSCSRL